MKSNKIIFLIPDLREGGGQRVISELSLNMPDTEPLIVLFKNKVSFPYRGRLASLNLSFSSNLLSRAVAFFTGIWRFRAMAKKEKPDFVVSVGTPANIINIFSGQRAILRVDGFMTSACRGLEGAVYKILIKLFFNKAEKIICVSRVSAEDLIKNFNIKRSLVEVIYNPVNMNRIQSLAEDGIPGGLREIFNKSVVISVGRLSREKNQVSLIRAFKDVDSKIKDCFLVIIGTGCMENFLKKTVKDLGLEGRVYFLGWQDNPFKFLAKAKVFVLSSLWEGLPYGVLEAMACGTPVVSVDCQSGPREILSPNGDLFFQANKIEYAEYGILTPAVTSSAGGEKKLGEAIIELLTNKERLENLSKKSKQRAEDFDIKKIIQQWAFLESRKRLK